MARRGKRSSDLKRAFLRGPRFETQGKGAAKVVLLTMQIVRSREDEARKEISLSGILSRDGRRAASAKATL